MTLTEIDRLIEAAKGEEKIAFALMAYARLRIGEVGRLRWRMCVKKTGVSRNDRVSQSPAVK